MYRTILVATDGSELSSKAVRAALRLGRDFAATVTAVNVQPPYQPALAAEVPAAFLHNPEQVEAEARQQSESILAEVRKLAACVGTDCDTRTVFHASVHQGLVEQAREIRADLIVMASNGRGSLGQLLLGSETTRVLETCRIPVLVHR